MYGPCSPCGKHTLWLQQRLLAAAKAATKVPGCREGCNRGCWLLATGKAAIKVLGCCEGNNRGCWLLGRLLPRLQAAMKATIELAGYYKGCYIGCRLLQRLPADVKAATEAIAKAATKLAGCCGGCHTTNKACWLLRLNSMVICGNGGAFEVKGPPRRRGLRTRQRKKALASSCRRRQRIGDPNLHYKFTFSTNHFVWEHEKIVEEAVDDPLAIDSGIQS
ncbi:hypothetical protein Tco_1522809 [Tanacetum coccineum]